jgi:signal transduction histidine kinase
MLNALDKNIADPEFQKDFGENLKKQQATITEVGEKELTMELSRNFAAVVQQPGNIVRQKEVRKDLTDIILLNMQAIQRKSSVAESTAKTSILGISVVGTICFLLALILLLNLPSNIANPIRELTESIKQIAAKNYSQRVHFESNDEFGELASAFNTMALKLQEYSSSTLAKLMMEKKRIETLINNMSEPVIGLDEQQNILFINNVAIQIAGLQGQSIIGKPIQDVASGNDLIKTLIRDLSESETKLKHLPVKIYADNKESYFEKEIIPIKIIPTGEKVAQYIGNVILLQNITSYKELDFAKTNFIATVSHELKTPISSIKMSLQLLENKRVGALNAEQQNLVESIKDDAGRLLKITGELLNMTQVESGSIQINIKPVDAKEIVAYAVGATRVAADQKQIKLIASVPDHLPAVLADEEKTTWILTNLLSNAIRYSYENATVSIDVKNEAGKIKFSVTDTGQGIPPEYIDKIFDRYFRIPGTKKEGTGLGLSISKEFIEAQDGQILVKSDFGTGSTFSFVLNAF